MVLMRQSGVIAITNEPVKEDIYMAIKTQPKEFKKGGEFYELDI